MKFLGVYPLILLLCLHINGINSQSGPDPWNSGNDEGQIPTLKRKSSDIRSNSRGGIGEWSFKRLLAIITKPSQIKKNDNKIDVSVQMTFSLERWRVLEEFLKTESLLSEDMFRRTLGYVEEAIYKPTIAETIAMAWSDNVSIYLSMYKIHITWLLGSLGALGVIIWLWKRMSQRHVIIMMLVLSYFYEVFISYKEVEQQELQRFISAVNACKWYFWTTDCEVPAPDLVIFMKHMNPGKIVIRMFTNWISEPIISMSTVIKTLIHGVTDGLWYPFDKIVYGILTVGINIMLITLFIMVIFNYIFNIPFNLGFLFFKIGILQRNRTVPSFIGNNEVQEPTNANRIGGATLDRFLEICSRAVETANVTRQPNTAALTQANNITRIKRSASTGRLPNLHAIENVDLRAQANHMRQRRNFNIDGSGDS